MSVINRFDNLKTNDRKLVTIINLISIVIFGAYIIKLRTLIYTPENMLFTKSEFIRFFNLILALLAVLSCLLTYRSNRKKELFLMCLVYIIFLLDILLSNIFSKNSDNIIAYIAMGTTLLRLGIGFIAISNCEVLKEIITKHSLKSIAIIICITLIVINLEYNYNIPESIYESNFHTIFNLFSFFLYLFISISFFKKSMKQYEYIYGVLATSILMFATKSLYSIGYQINLNKEIPLTSVSITYIGFIILIIGLFMELSQSINKNKILEDQKSLFFNIVEQSKYSNIIVCDEAYDILYINKKALSNIEDIFSNYLYKYNSDEKYKFNLNDIFKNILPYNNINSYLIKDGYYNEEISIKEKNIFLDVSIQLFERDNKKYKVIFFKDIQEKYIMKSALLENEMLKNEEKMKQEFFANISHELKTPLNIIYSTMQLLNNNLDKDNFKDLYIKYKNSFDINCKRMIRLIDNIVDITKLDIGFEKPNFINYDIVRLVEDITISVINYAKIKNIEVIFDTEIEELKIKCDPDMVERIILNLLSNSIKYTSNNGNILVYVSLKRDWVDISIKDNGIGIPDYMQSRIYDKFFQGDKSFTRENEGSGIGLSIVKSIVDLIGGKISLISDLKNGTEFKISLPNEILKDNKLENKIENYHEIDIQKIQLEFSDIYEIQDTI